MVRMLSEDGFAQGLAHHLDLPDQIPPGFTFSDYVSGFPYKDQYIYARTSPDHTAKRSGMVFSHAVVVAAAGASAITDISSLLHRLCKSRPSSPAAKRFSIDTTKVTSNIRSYPGIAQGLARGNLGPVVVSNTEILESAVVSIWPNLPSALRPRFRFRLSFGPDDVEKNPADLVVAPAAMAMRWPSEALVEDPSVQGESPTAAARLLSGSPEPQFVQFLKDLDILIDSFRLLSRIDDAWQRYHQTPPTFSSALTAARLVASLQPSPDKAISYKRDLVQKLASEAAPCTLSDILQLRNLDIAPFGDVESLRRKLAASIHTIMTNETNYDEIEPVISSALEISQTVPFWRSAFDEAMSAIKGAELKPFSCLVWAALSHSVEHGVFLINKGPARTSLDPALSRTLPEDGVSHDLLVNTLLDCDLPLSEATLLANHYKDDINSALEYACERKIGRHASVAIEFIVDKMNSKAVLSAAASIDHSIVRKKAVEITVKTPSVLAGRDFSIANYQCIWAEAITRDADAWNIDPQVRQTVDKLFSDVIHKKGHFDEILLKALASTPLANLVDHPERTILWPILPSSVKSLYIDATTAALIRQLAKNVTGALHSPLEPDLAAALSNQAHRQALIETFSNIPFATVLELYSAVDDFGESTFRNVFSSAIRSSNGLSRELVEQSAQLIMTRRWSRTTQTLLNDFGVSTTLRPLFEICATHLDIWTRFIQKINQPTPAEIYELLADVATTLYTKGPSDQAIWTRAGGHEADLEFSGNGRAQWSNAVNRIRYGGAVSAQSLLDEMRNDFPRNAQLDYLRQTIR